MAHLEPLPTGEPGALLHLEEIESALVESLTTQMIDLVGVDSPADEDPLVAMVGIDPAAAPSEDPALLRLLPDAYPDDDDASSEFRRFTERDLRSAKVRHAVRVRESVAARETPIAIAGEDVTAWLGFLNDARLVIGTRLGVTEENHEELAELPDDDPRAALFGVYGWLTYLQETVVQMLMGHP